MEYGYNRKILFFFNNLGIGGAQKILLFLANKCAEQGFNVILIVLSNIENTMPMHKNIIIHYIGFETRDQINKGFIKRKSEQLFLVIKIRKLIKRINPELICSFMPSIIKYITYATKGMTIPLVGSERDNPYLLPEGQLKKDDKVYEGCEVVVFQTERAKQLFSEKVQNKSFVIPNPCIPRVKHIDPYKGDKDRIFVAAGRLEKTKQFDILIYAFKKVLERHSGYKLHIYGDGTQKRNLENIIKKNNLDGIVILKGKVDDVFSVEYNCTGFILSSMSEGIPNVLIEAMSIGIPCISTDCEPGGPRLLFDNGRRGRLVPVGDIEKLSKEICYYIENPEIAERFGMLGLEVIREFEPDYIASRWIEIFNSIPQDK